MSKTDKDTPEWVHVLHHPNPLPRHSWRCVKSNMGWSHPNLQQECDINNTINPRTNKCVWVLPEIRTRWFTKGPTAKHLHLWYYDPERAAIRTSLNNAKREYNHNGEVDEEPPNRQKKTSTWYGGYWD